MNWHARALRSLVTLVALPTAALAGPNQGGALVVHAPPSITYTTDQQSYCGQSGLTLCSQVVDSTSSEPEVPRVWFILASFDPSSSPRLKALSYGVWYDSTRLAITAYGSCGDFELPDDRWPRPGSGTAVSWTQPQTEALEEVSWFAGYTYVHAPPDTASFCTLPHPRHGGEFVDDAVPPETDPVIAFGRLGFGAAGVVTCYQPLSDGGESIHPPENPDPYLPDPGAPPSWEPGRFWRGTEEVRFTWEQLADDAFWDDLWSVREGPSGDTLFFCGYPSYSAACVARWDALEGLTPLEKTGWRLVEEAGQSVREIADRLAQASAFVLALRDLDPERRFVDPRPATDPEGTVAFRIYVGGDRSRMVEMQHTFRGGRYGLPSYAPIVPRVRTARSQLEIYKEQYRQVLSSGQWLVGLPPYPPSPMVPRRLGPYFDSLLVALRAGSPLEALVDCTHPRGTLACRPGHLAWLRYIESAHTR